MDEMTMIIQDLKTKFNREKQKRTQSKMKMELKSSSSQSENSKENFIMAQVEDRVSGREDRVGEFNHTGQDDEN